MAGSELLLVSSSTTYKSQLTSLLNSEQVPHPMDIDHSHSQADYYSEESEEDDDVDAQEEDDDSDAQDLDDGQWSVA